MRIVPAKEFQQWLEESQIIEQDGRGPKVLRMPDGRLLKIFRPRRRLWLARLRPSAKIFARNALQLAGLGIKTPQVSESLWLDQSQAISACFYTPLPGISLDKLFQNSRKNFEALLPDLAAFIRLLHQRGIYFRSLHLGNILLLPDSSFGLIDFLDLRIKHAPLNATMVQRNFQHLKGYMARSKINDFPWQRLLQLYNDHL